jgi:hypothetical protein
VKKETEKAKGRREGNVVVYPSGLFNSSGCLFCFSIRFQSFLQGLECALHPLFSFFLLLGPGLDFHI